MRIVVAGASNPVGAAIVGALLHQGYDVLAADKEFDRELSCPARLADITDTQSLEGLCAGADMVISAAGMQKADPATSYFKLDLRGNINLLGEARSAGVKKFVFISILNCDRDANVPMFAAKHEFERALMKSGLNYLILRPTWYFHDMKRIFLPMAQSGCGQLLSRRKVRVNPIAAEDLADFLIEHMPVQNEILDVGGHESYTFAQIMELFFEALGKKPVYGYAAPFVFALLKAAARRRKDGTFPRIVLSKWMWNHGMTAETRYGSRSFKQYAFDQSEQ